MRSLWRWDMAELRLDEPDARLFEPFMLSPPLGKQETCKKVLSIVAQARADQDAVLVADSKADVKMSLMGHSIDLALSPTGPVSVSTPPALSIVIPNAAQILTVTVQVTKRLGSTYLGPCTLYTSFIWHEDSKVDLFQDTKVFRLSRSSTQHTPNL